MPTPAPCCKLALHEATEHWPNRDKSSDGIMGDSHHQQHHSDHNLGNAFDVTNDPAHSVNCEDLSKVAIQDGRVTYVIWNRHIFNRTRAAEGWRAYHGENPHDHHMHVSIKPGSRDDLAPWPWAIPGSKATPESGGEAHSSSHTNGTVPPFGAYPGQPLRESSNGPEVRSLQHRLKERGWRVNVDGSFGPQTRDAILHFQRNHNLLPDGIAGPKTWAALAAPVNAALPSPTALAPSNAHAGSARHSANRHHNRPGNVVSFIDMALPAAKRVHSSYGVPVSFMIAQGGLESGWGQHVKHNAYFGIKGKAPSGATASFGTTEYENGKKVHKSQNFRAYLSFDEAADDYGKFLTTQPRYRPAFSHRDDPKQFAQAIARAGYATDPNYAQSIISIMNSYDLFEYDK